jgi:hypothetical protein
VGFALRHRLPPERRLAISGQAKTSAPQEQDRGYVEVQLVMVA